MTDRLGCVPANRVELEAALVRKYRDVARDPRGHFGYPTGAEGARTLGYDEALLARMPAELLERFVGVGNPTAMLELRPGQRVLDAGCGAGLDVFAAARAVGPGGIAVGVDLIPELLVVGRRAPASALDGAVEFVTGSLERLPFEDATFDAVISNGALNLVFDKQRAFAELARVLRPGGELAAADLLVIDSIPAHVLAEADAWST